LLLRNWLTNNMWRHASAKGVILGVLVVFFVGAVGIGYLMNPVARDESESLTELGFTLAGLDDFAITNRFGSTVRADKELNITAHRDGDVLRVKILSNQSGAVAERFMTGASILLEAQYDSRLPPYPEFLTNSTGCAKRFLPEKREGPTGMYYLVNADERFNYGLCADDLIYYKSGFGLFYCTESSTAFQIEYFIDKSRPLGDIDNFMQSFACSSIS
jgi:hypothetical protein